MDITANLEASPPAPLILRKDYTPFAWNIPQIALNFALGLEVTHVTATLQIERNPLAEPAKEIRLNGDGISAVTVRLDGEEVNNWRMDGPDLLLALTGDTHTIEITTQINPAKNTSLMGLYASGGMLCTQCEAEGFRSITFFPDRPDVLSVYSVRMSGSKTDFPVLLSNGNLSASGEGDNGEHWADWHDPWPKPSYLFALVAGDLVANSSSFTTMNGREVALNIYVRAGDLERTDHAMASLKSSMKWDEEQFGREYDLDLFNIVAVSDFNMGAMENKGLNIFNTKYVLADQETASDGDFDGVEGVIAHEYFHNWSGNRITCRDWFQLSLKEGFTVLRDQLFSQDMGSEPVKRIEDVRILRAAQFPEDSGPLAHPIRPDQYREISNFYTATIYNKGAEVIRMMRTMAGEEAFRKGCDLYFERHDGQAATCEDFVRAIEEGAGLDLEQFRLWYSQAGTPKVTARLEKEGGVATLHLAQEVPATPGQNAKSPMPIPQKVALFDPETGEKLAEKLLVLDKAEASFAFDGLSAGAAKPALSINRGFTAPVTINRATSSDELVFLAAHDDDPFARFEAMQELVTGHLLGSAKGDLDDTAQDQGRAAIASAMQSVISDERLDDLMRAELLGIPSEAILADQMANQIGRADPGAIHQQRDGLREYIGGQLSSELGALHQKASGQEFSLDAAARGARKIKTQALSYLAAGNPSSGAQLAGQQYQNADNMTDRQGALMVLAGLNGIERTNALLDFYNRFKDNPLVVDKWFAIQASSSHNSVIEHVKALASHPQFTLSNPNRVRSLYMVFAHNPSAFHDENGEGYEMIGDLILALDPINPQTTARFVPPLGRWKRIEPKRSGLMRAQLERIAAEPKLSRDTREQVERSLG